VEALERFRSGLGLDDVLLVVHDWGGLIGLRWACDHPEAVSALVISDSGFFPDGRWHGMAEGLRTEGQGEEIVESLDRDTFGLVLKTSSSGIDDEAVDEYWKCFADEVRRRGQLELYRSGDFSKLEAYRGKLGELDVPALLLWGADDSFAPLGGAKRFEKELADSRLVVMEGTGHFVWDDAGEDAARELAAWLP
jgi:haloalkane dehalogenase